MSKTTTRSSNPDFDSLVPNTPYTRRAFVITMLGVGFALATQPVMADTVIKTGTDGLVAGAIKVPVRDGEMVAYRAQPDKGANFPVILVVSEIFGVHEHIADICRRLAKLGYLAIAPELFARHGDPRKIASIQAILDDIVAKVPDTQVMSDLDACEAWAKAHGGDTSRLAVTGFCWGGRITWLYAANNPRHSNCCQRKANGYGQKSVPLAAPLDQNRTPALATETGTNEEGGRQVTPPRRWTPEA